MIDIFNNLLEGTFENKKQAFSFPSKFAYIRVVHVNIGNGLFYGEQAYNYNLNSPYRQFVLEPILEGDKIRIINYEIENKENFKGFKNLENISKSNLKIREGCDVVVTRKNGNTFVGGIEGCECAVKWMDRDTYLKNEIELSEEYYCVIDKGFCSTHHHQMWGSKYGRFEFARM